MSRTASSSATSAWIVSSPSASSDRSTPTTRAPSSENSRAVSAPMPLAAPVITQTLSSSRPGMRLALRRVVDVLHLGVGLERIRAELPPDTGLLEAAERRGDAHRGVGVDGDHAGLDRAGDTDRLAPVARPHRAREP